MKSDEVTYEIVLQTTGPFAARQQLEDYGFRKIVIFKETPAYWNFTDPPAHGVKRYHIFATGHESCATMLKLTHPDIPLTQLMNL